MQVSMELTGTTPLLLHSSAGVNPEHPGAQRIAALTATYKKTPAGRKEISRTEWHMGLYTDESGTRLVVPCANVFKCLVQAGKLSRQGTQVQRSLAFYDVDADLEFDGADRPIDDLFDDPRYVDMRAVGISRTSRIMRTRPRFLPWGLTINGELFEDIMDPRDLTTIAEKAGRIEGLGDNRCNGFGRFTVKVTVA